VGELDDRFSSERLDPHRRLPLAGRHFTSLPVTAGTTILQMEEKRRLHFTSPGFRSQEIIIAPALDDSKSKRKPLIDGEVSNGIKLGEC
jgi:hypothetical protein